MSQLGFPAVPKDLPGLLPNQFSARSLVCADTGWSAPLPNAVAADPLPESAAPRFAEE
jgi:hypothetical protein